MLSYTWRLINPYRRKIPLQTLQVSLSSDLWQQLQNYRRARGEQLGIPVVDVQIAIAKLLEEGLAQQSSDPAHGELASPQKDTEPSLASQSRRRKSR